MELEERSLPCSKEPFTDPSRETDVIGLHKDPFASPIFLRPVTTRPRWKSNVKRCMSTVVSRPGSHKSHSLMHRAH
jgi:hypothetical protein